ncbi:hypothetical protein EG329_011209 [Mollisiaceae sp. DMI_Dod_QoI]|nr:hypothetical protein EG329_011209 [Helotiales sp. DMI_Dod_QoI]
MSLSNDTTETSIKYESPYENGTESNSLSGSSRKRRNSNQESPEKRQRVDDDDLHLVTLEFAAYVSQTAVASDGYPRDSSANTNHNVAEGTVGVDGAIQSGFEYDPYFNMRILSLPILESLSVQILSTLTEGDYTTTVSGIANQDSEFYQAHATLVSLFDQTKKIYSNETTFLSARQLNIREPKDKKLIHMTNVATYVAAVFGGTLGLGDLDENFLETFAPEGAPLEEKPGQLLVNLKTQMYLSSVSQEEQEDTREDLLERYFSPLKLRKALENRHMHLPLTDSEERYLSFCSERIRYLMGAPNDIETIQRLMAEFPWEGFLIELREHVHQEPFVQPYAVRHALPNPSPPPRMSDGYREFEGIPITDDFSAQISSAAQAALQTIGVESQHGASHENRQIYQQSNKHPTQANSNGAPPESTKALYDKARQAAAAKSNPGNARIRPGMPSQRRPWSTAEENALMTGLDQVKGPHWSQILGLYGPSGSINNVLKDRNQVQLKDKARNIKLFFLKSGFKVPSYLQQVTGELKTRAPTQAARKEAEERARLAGDDERARIDGIGILASGLQSQDQAGSRHSSPSHSISPPDYASPEEFQVVEPDNEESSMLASQSEQLRQALLSASHAVLTSF